MRLRCALVVALALCTGCVSTQQNRDVLEFEIEAGVTTKRDLILQFGAPSGMRRQGADSVLVFSSSEQNGVGYGLALYSLSLAVESTHSGLDFLEVVIGPDRIVRSYRLAAVPREHPRWPSDD